MTLLPGEDPAAFEAVRDLIIQQLQPSSNFEWLWRGQAKLRAPVVVWGIGSPMREFLYVDDMAEACLHIMNCHRRTTPVIPNRCCRTSISALARTTIRLLASAIADPVVYRGKIAFDTTKPDDTPRKLMDIGRLHGLGWHAKTRLREGLELAYADFLANCGQLLIGTPSNVPKSPAAVLAAAQNLHKTLVSGYGKHPSSAMILSL